MNELFLARIIGPTLLSIGLFISAYNKHFHLSVGLILMGIAFGILVNA